MSTPLAHDVRIAQAIVEEILAAGVDHEDPDLSALVESECDLPERLRRILRYSRHVESQTKALAEMMSEMRDRKARMEKKSETLRSAVKWAMSETGLKKLDAPDLTATLSDGKPKVTITDEDALPDMACRIKREPNKTRIAELLAEGPVAGACLANAEPVLTVRVR